MDQLNFYADEVDYFDDGIVSKEAIAADLAKYTEAWPERSLRIQGDATFTPLVATTQEVRFHLSVSLKNPNLSRSHTGLNEVTLRIQETLDHRFQITHVKSRSLSAPLANPMPIRKAGDGRKAR